MASSPEDAARAARRKRILEQSQSRLERLQATMKETLASVSPTEELRVPESHTDPSTPVSQPIIPPLPPSPDVDDVPVSKPCSHGSTPSETPAAVPEPVPLPVEQPSTPVVEEVELEATANPALGFLLATNIRSLIRIAAAVVFFLAGAWPPFAPCAVLPSTTIVAHSSAPCTLPCRLGVAWLLGFLRRQQLSHSVCILSRQFYQRSAHPAVHRVGRRARGLGEGCSRLAARSGRGHVASSSHTAVGCHLARVCTCGRDDFLLWRWHGNRRPVLRVVIPLHIAFLLVCLSCVIHAAGHVGSMCRTMCHGCSRCGESCRLVGSNELIFHSRLRWRAQQCSSA